MHSAYLKIGRAKEHITDLAKLIEETPPFTYVYKIYPVTGERGVGPKHNEPVKERVALLAGDAIHNLRTALDQVIWSIVGPLTNSDRERKRVAFPFRDTEVRFKDAIAEGPISRAPPAVIAVLERCKPYSTGNKLLYALHDLDIIDKHRLLVPMADYKEVRGSTLAAQIPGFPSMFVGMTFGGGNNGTPEYGGDLAWAGPPRPGAYAAVIEKELDVPVEVVLAWGSSNNPKRMVSTLHRLVNLTAEIVGNLLDASNSHS